MSPPLSIRHCCIDCGAEFADGFHPFCDSCGGLVDVAYPLAPALLTDSLNPYKRFAALLPFTTGHERLPRSAYTPMVHAKRLGASLGMNSLYLKDESALPTRSTKDRMAVISLAYLHERGVRRFTASSTGNSSTAFAYRIAAYPDMHLFLFTAEHFVPRVQYADRPQVTHFGMRDASFVEASDYAGRYARQHGLIAESGFFNPGRREGLKLAFLEACEQVPAPIDWYVQAVSSAMGVYGAYKGAKELRDLGMIERLPRLLCVQQESCAPMVRAFADGSETIRPEHKVAKPAGIADAILRGDPTRAYPYIRRVVIESAGDFTAVSENEIREARRLVGDTEHLYPCFSASAALAGLIKRARKDGAMRDAVVVVNLTGGDRPEPSRSKDVEWIDKIASGWDMPPPDAVR